MADASADAFTRVVRESAYVAVGFGLLGFQRAQVRRRELLKQLQANPDLMGGPLAGAGQRVGQQLVGARRQLTDVARSLDERVQPARTGLSSRIDELEGRLPPGARDALHSVRRSVQTQEQVLRAAVGLDR